MVTAPAISDAARNLRGIYPVARTGRPGGPMTQDPSLPPGGAGPPLVPDFAACGTAEGVVVTKLAPMPQQARLTARSAVLDMRDAARQKRIILVNAAA